MQSLDVHIARLLLLVDSFSQRSGMLDGLTKIAKLDFLLRYPVFLERLNERRGITDLTWPPVRAAERISVDGPMIRYKYGPWDRRYYALVGGLVGRGLTEYVPGQGSVALRPTDLGREVSSDLRQQEQWTEIRGRLDFLSHHYDMPGSMLKDLIYETFPSILDQTIGSPIQANPGTND